MQSNDDVGKVAAASTHLVVCAIEEFLDDLVKGAVDKAESRGSKLLSGAHLKARVMEQPTLDFCKSVVERAADLKDQETSVPAKRSRQKKDSNDDHSNNDTNDEQEEIEVQRKKPRATKKKKKEKETTRTALPVKQEEEEEIAKDDDGIVEMNEEEKSLLKQELKEELEEEFMNQHEYDDVAGGTDFCLEAEEEDYDDL